MKCVKHAHDYMWLEGKGSFCLSESVDRKVTLFRSHECHEWNCNFKQHLLWPVSLTFYWFIEDIRIPLRMNRILFLTLNIFIKGFPVDFHYSSAHSRCPQTHTKQKLKYCRVKAPSRCQCMPYFFRNTCWYCCGVGSDNTLLCKQQKRQREFKL